MVSSCLWADNDWFMSHSNMHLKQMMKVRIEEAERWDLDPKTGKFVFVEHICTSKKEDIMSKTKKRSAQLSVRKKFQDSGLHLQVNSAGKMQDSLEERIQTKNGRDTRGQGRHGDQDKKKGLIKLLLCEKVSKMLGYIFNTTGNSHDSFEERMQKAHKAWLRDARIYGSEDASWQLQTNGGASLQ